MTNEHSDERGLGPADDPLRYFPQETLAALRREDVLAAVLRTQLLAQRDMTRLVVRSLPRPEHVNLNRMSLAQLAELAAGLDAFGEPEMLGAYRELNRLRNRLAHEWNGDITEADQEALFTSLPAWAQELALDLVRPERPRFPELLRATLAVLLVWLLETLEHQGSRAET